LGEAVRCAVDARVESPVGWDRTGTIIMTLNEYLAQPDTPSAKSPVGTLIVKILEKYPEMTFEDARSSV